MSLNRKIIVVTPVKNESWILEQFLTATSCFADYIILADQNSTDNSRKIADKFPKVILIENKSLDYNEAERQQLLIDYARRIAGLGNIIFTLDCDEIITWESIQMTRVWEQIMNASNSTVFYFEKPEVLSDLKRVVRWRNAFFPLAFLDDGQKHTAKLIHSTRVPINEKSNCKYIQEIKFLHFGHTRFNAISSKMRYYCVIENLRNTRSFWVRRFLYASYYTEDKYYPKKNIEELPKHWLSDWALNGVRLAEFPDPNITWRELEVLNIFHKCGKRRFFLDPIWDYDWRALAFNQQIKRSSKFEFWGPFLPIKIFLRICDFIYLGQKIARQKIKLLTKVN